MHVSINLDDNDFNDIPPRRKQAIRAAAYFLLNAIGDINDEGEVVPTGTSPAPVPSSKTASAPPPPPTASSDVPPPPPPIPAPPTDGETPPPPPSNVVHGNFPQAGSVPPPPVSTAGGPAPSSGEVATGAAAASGPAAVASVELDSANLPWDARIHQSGKSKKKDGTWKLKKLFNSTPEKEAEFNALVQAVTAEHAAKRSQVSLPLGSSQTGSAANTVPVPPLPNATAAQGVPASNGTGAPVPPPPVPAAGAVGATTPYRILIDKITDLTKGGKITPAKVMEICQTHGAPSLMALNGMPHLIENVGKDIDAAALGLL